MEGTDEPDPTGIQRLLSYVSCAAGLFAARGELSLAAAFGNCVRLYADEVR